MSSYLIKIFSRVISGFYRVENEMFAFLGSYTAQTGTSAPTFRDSLFYPSSRVKNSLNYLTLEDMAGSLSPKRRYGLPIYAAWDPRRAQVSDFITFLRQKVKTPPKCTVLINIPKCNQYTSSSLGKWDAHVSSILRERSKGKVLPTTGHEGPDGEYRYSPTLSWPRRLGGGGWSAPRPGRFTPRKDPVPIVQEAGWATGPVWTGAENLALTGIRSPD